MTKPFKQALCLSLLWIAGLIVLACAGCAQKPSVVYTPTEVLTPVPVVCKPPVVVRPDDMLAALRMPTTLTQGMKAALAQHDLDLGYQGQLEAAVTACQ